MVCIRLSLDRLGMPRLWSLVKDYISPIPFVSIRLFPFIAILSAHCTCTYDLCFLAPLYSRIFVYDFLCLFFVFYLSLDALFQKSTYYQLHDCVGALDRNGGQGCFVAGLRDSISMYTNDKVNVNMTINGPITRLNTQLPNPL